MICDLAETYHILNYKELSPSLVAVLVLGLRENSRTKMKLSNQKLTLEQTLFAMLVDEVRFQSWTHSKDAHKGRAYKSKSVLKTLRGEYEVKKEELISFENINDYESYMIQFKQ